VKHIFDSEIKRKDNENNFFTVVYTIHYTLLGYEIQGLMEFMGGNGNVQKILTITH
jgi:hypothetical protein